MFEGEQVILVVRLIPPGQRRHPTAACLDGFRWLVDPHKWRSSEAALTRSGSDPPSGVG